MIPFLFSRNVHAGLACVPFIGPCGIVLVALSFGMFHLVGMTLAGGICISSIMWCPILLSHVHRRFNASQFIMCVFGMFIPFLINVCFVSAEKAESGGGNYAASTFAFAIVLAAMKVSHPTVSSWRVRICSTALLRCIALSCIERFLAFLCRWYYFLQS